MSRAEYEWHERTHIETMSNGGPGDVESDVEAHVETEVENEDGNSRRRPNTKAK